MKINQRNTGKTAVTEKWVTVITTCVDGKFIETRKPFGKYTHATAFEKAQATYKEGFIFKNIATHGFGGYFIDTLTFDTYEIIPCV